jgi:hypothetical protein
MQAPTGCMGDEIDEILGRDIKKLATARDVPRLVKHLSLWNAEGTCLFDGGRAGGVLEFLSILHGACNNYSDAKTAPQHASDQSDIVRHYVVSLKQNSVPLFVLHCSNQNVIAPAVLRLKYESSRSGFQTKDGDWKIVVELKEGQQPGATVTHIREEMDVKGSFRFSWKLEVGAKHKLSIVSVDVLRADFDPTLLRQVLDKCVESAMRNSNSLQLPDVSSYTSSYFNWK